MCLAVAKDSMTAALIANNTLVLAVATKVKKMLQNVLITRFRRFGRISSLYVYERLFDISGSSIESVSSNANLIWLWLWGKNYPT